MSTGLIVTLVFLAAIFGYAGLEGVRLYWKLRTLSSEIRDATVAVRAGSSFTNSALEGPWARYRATFLAPSGSREKTDARASDYFGESSVLSGLLSLRYWLSIPNILVGLGILGTFVGLAIGIAGFDANTSEQIRDGINNLLTGMATAFITSIVGMAASIVFGVWEKDRFRRVANTLRGLTSALDARYLITTADRLRFAQQDQYNLLGSLFGYKTEEGTVRPGDALQAIRLESEQQTTALKQFSTDLADGIMLSTLTIEKLGMNMGKVFTDAMRTTLAPTLDGVRVAVEQMTKEKAASNDAMVKDTVGKLQDALEKMGQDFQQALSGGALTQLETVAASLGEAHGALSALPATVQELLDQMRNTVNQSNGKMVEGVMATSDTIREQTEQTVNEFGKAIQAIQNQTQSILDQQSKNSESTAHLTDRVRGLIEALGAAASQLRAATEGVQSTLSNIENLSRTLGTSAETLSHSSDTLKVTASAFGEDSKGWLEANRDNLTALREALEESRRVGADYTERFGIIEGGLKNVFGELEQGLGAYQSSTSESLNRYLGEFTEHLSAAASALSGSVSTLDESLQELVDAVEATARPRANGIPRS